MRITLNGSEQEVAAGSLAELVDEAGYASAVVATAVNGEFVPRGERPATKLRQGDRVEVVSPRQGG